MPSAPAGRAADFDYRLPPGRIAMRPTLDRSGSRLLHVPRRGNRPFRDLSFRDLPSLMTRDDLLVLNDTRVMPARLVGEKPTGARAEILLLHPLHEGRPVPWGQGSGREWEALVRPGSKLGPGRTVRITSDLSVQILESMPSGNRSVRLDTSLEPLVAIDRYGQVPIPPYLDRPAEAADRDRYQTVYARVPGSVAAPTAGLHFTEGLLGRIAELGICTAHVTLHVGVGTFRPVDASELDQHVMHEEWYHVPAVTAQAVRSARDRGGRVWAVGTTVARTLEAAADDTRGVRAEHGATRLFIRPPYEFRVVDALVTNFHLPRSTLLMLVAALAGYDTVMAAYQHAVRNGYRFYSYGDAMVIT